MLVLGVVGFGVGESINYAVYDFGDNEIMCQRGGLDLLVMKDLVLIVLQNKEPSLRIIV